MVDRETIVISSSDTEEDEPAINDAPAETSSTATGKRPAEALTQTSKRHAAASSFVLVIISDTHGHHEEVKLPKPEEFPNAVPVLLHCGDFTNIGELSEVAAFAEWFAKLVV